MKCAQHLHLELVTRIAKIMLVVHLDKIFVVAMLEVIAEVKCFCRQIHRPVFPRGSRRLSGKIIGEQGFAVAKVWWR